MQLNPQETRKRQREKWAVVVLVVLIFLLVTLEIIIARRNNAVPFGQSVLLFGLINFNLILFLVLIFFSFRNVAKVFLDRTRVGKGSSLRKKLVLAFTLFATVPTFLLSATSAFYVYQSFEKWFSARIVDSFQQSLQVTQAYYDESKNRAEHWANFVMRNLENNPDILQDEKNEELESYINTVLADYKLDWINVSTGFPARSIMRWRNELGQSDVLELSHDEVNELKETGKTHVTSFFSGGELSRLTLSSRKIPNLEVSVGTVIPLLVSQRSGSIHLNLEDFKKLLPIQRAVKTTFLVTLVGMVLLILAFSSWLGVYISRRLIKPLEDLTEATHELAEGHWSPVTNAEESIYEYQMLAGAFNEMGQKIQTAQMHLEGANRKLSETNRELEHEKTFLEVLVKSVDFGVLALDLPGNVTIQNEALLRILGVSELPSERSQLADIFRPIFPRFGQFLAQTSEAGSTPRFEMEEHVGDDSKNTLIKIISIPLITRSNLYSGVVFIFEDLTQLQANQRNLAWKEVARRLAHEFKNPLTPIRLSAERLNRNAGRLTDSMVEAATRSIILSVEQLTQLVDEFSRYAKLPETQVEEGSISQMIRDTVEIYRQGHPQTEFQVKIEESIPKFLFDSRQLGRAISNLIKNSVQVLGGQDGGRVEIQVTHKARVGVVTIVVSDNGPGLTDQVAKRIFEPYFSTKKRGTGLGLAIVQRIVQDHQGVIRVQRNAPHGTRFVIDLPVRTTDSNLSHDEGRAVSLEAT